VSGITSSTALWYASRATGVVALLLMTAVVLLGLLVARNGKLPGLPRFAVTGLHRNLSLTAVAFVALHVLTAVTDGYVSIPLIATFVPLASGYESMEVGLGAVSLDLALAVIVTSLVRSRLNPKAWRAIHLLAYVSWPGCTASPPRPTCVTAGCSCSPSPTCCSSSPRRVGGWPPPPATSRAPSGSAP
jgi:methionine sulfoxide reductase heme-binding subunit